MTDINKAESVEFGRKRTCLPGVVLETKCQGCGAAVTIDLGNNAIEYLVSDTPEEVGTCCGSCDAVVTMNVVVRVSVETI